MRSPDSDDPAARDTAAGPRGPRRHSHREGARKERVLHTRVSEQLSEDIRRLAEDLRVPASNLVRNVLEEVFTVVDRVSGDMGELFDDLIHEAEGVRDRVRNQPGWRRRRSDARGSAPLRRRGAVSDAEVEDELRRDEATEIHSSAAELFPEILGWQPLVLNRDLACGRCARPLAAGESAFLGLAEHGLTRIALCGRCVGTR